MRLYLCTALICVAPGLGAQQGADPGSRGALLYQNHCIECHNTQMHWRDQRLARDWDSLRAQVQRWQGVAQLGWSQVDIEEVARHLNETIYGFEPPTRTSAAPVGNGEPRPRSP